MNPIIQKIDEQILNYKREDLVQKRWQEHGLSGESKGISWRYMPSAQNYFSELNPSFIWDYRSIESMSTFPVILLRDGFYGLSYFFLKNTKPIENFSTLLCIPAKFKSLIPKSWESNTLLYEFDYKQKSTDAEKAIFFGVPSRESFYGNKLLKNIEGAFDEIDHVDFNVYCRDRLFNEFKNEQNYFFDIQKSVLKKFGSAVKSHYEFKEMDWSSVGQRHSFFNIDQNNFLIYSDYLTFLYASKGASFINKPTRLIKDSNVVRTIDLSPYHSLKLSKPTGLTNDSLKRLIKIRLSKVPLIYHNIQLYHFLSDEFKVLVESN
jgi:hypothetical protein